MKIKIPVTVRRGISKRSHEKIGDCEQCRNVFKGGGKRVILVDENDVTILTLFVGGGGGSVGGRTSVLKVLSP